MARLLWRDPFWDGKRKPFIIAVTSAGLMLLLLFLGNLCYLYGSLFQSGDRTHAFKILAVDFDGGVIGQSLSGAYNELKSSAFPTLEFHSSTEYPTITSVQDAICKGGFWGAVIAQPGASGRLSAAFSGGNAATNYNSSDTLTYIWNGARYPAVQLGEISGNLETLIGAASSVYHLLNGTGALSSLDTTSSSAVIAYGNPISSSNINIATTNQPDMFHALHNPSIYTFLASLAVAGYIWAFREGWDVNGVQFVLVWTTFWLFMHINFGVLDAATAFIPASFLAFFVLTWAIINITSTIYPFELNAGFYRWGWALPAHSTWLVLIQIYSEGCNNKLHIALPILFSWWVVGVGLAIIGTFYRNKGAKKMLLDAEEKEKELLEQGRRATLEEIEQMGDAASRENLTYFPMPFQSMIYDEKARLALKRKATV